MHPKPVSCLGCPLQPLNGGAGWVGASGSGSNGILLVGEAAGADEERVGRPFVGAAGFYLDRLLKRAGLDREAFRIHNVLSCRPPGNNLLGAPYEHSAIRHCAPNLDHTVSSMRPSVVVALGGIPLRRLTAGEYDRISRIRGFVLPGPEGSWLIPTFHPSYLLPREGQANTSRFVGAVIWDLKRAVKIARDGFSRRPCTYLCDPPPAAAEAWADEFFLALRGDPAIWLSWDIETDYKLKVADEEALSTAQDDEDGDDDEAQARPAHDPILRIGFSYRAGHALSIPWAGPYLPTITRLLLGAPRTIGWNSSTFDVPTVEAALGVTLPGVNYDFMWAWHLLQSDLPRGLEAVAAWATDLLPWKHQAEALPAWYNAVDADAALRCALWIEAELRSAGQWALFERHVVALDPILIRAGRTTGVHIDLAAQGALEARLAAEQRALDEATQGAVPDVVRPRKYYKRAPKGQESHVETTTLRERVCSACGKLRVNVKHPCLKTGATLGTAERVGEVYFVYRRFNPNSVQQLLAYIRHFKHPYATHRKTGKISIPKKHLQRLARTFGAKHPLYALALRARAVKKTLGTYVRGFKPDAHGKIYTTYTYAPSSGRLSSREVNLQNVSHRGTALFAEEVRRTIIPADGMVFVEADSSAIEAVLTGYFMGSADYIALAKRGIHDYLVCLDRGLRFPDDIARCKTEFKGIRDRKKVLVHGTAYGMTPRLLYYENYEIFQNEGQARREQRAFLDVCPGLETWQDDVRRQAHKTTYLQNPWGYRHYFYDVFGKRGKDGRRELGSDAKRAVSFLPQSAAAAIMKDNARLLAQAVDPAWIPANFLCHDSYLIQCPKSEAPYIVALLEATLTRAIPELQGLRIGCEIKVGERNWADLETVKVCPSL